MKKSPIKFFAYISLFSYLLQVVPAHAADTALESMVSRLRGQTALPEAPAAEFVLRKYPGEKLIPVRILGGVNRPGIYYLPEGTDLLTAISLSAGLSSEADLHRVHHAQGNKTGSTTRTLHEMFEDPKLNPKLTANDLLYVEEQQPALSNNTMLLLTALSSIVGITLGAIAISKTK